jgi:hypothetical protein
MRGGDDVTPKSDGVTSMPLSRPTSNSFGDLIREELLHRAIERRAGLRHLERIEIAARHEKPAFLVVHGEIYG